MPRLRPLFVVATLALLLAACGPAGPTVTGPTAAPAPADATAAPAPADATAAPAPADATAAPAASGGTLRIGRTAGPDSLNPGAAYLVEAGEIQNLVYDSLINVDLQGKAYPGLAKEWSVSADSMVWTFKLVDGATWHDGTPLTSADVKFTFEMIKGFDSFGLIKDYTSLLDKVEAPDPTTVVVSFSKPVANTDERFSALYILPKHIWGNFKDAKAASEFENKEMIGSGPFKLAEYKQGEFTRLVANKGYYGGSPKIDEVIFRVFGTGDAMVQALRSGEIDLMGVPNNTVVPTLKADPNIKVEIGNSRSLTDIIFNTTTKENCPPDVGKCTGHPALKDPKVRQALAYATDRQQLIDVILLGLGSPGLSLVTPGAGDAYAKNVAGYGFDLEKAKQTFEDAGYKDTDGDGIREMPGDPSQPLKFRYSYPSDQSANGQRFFELLSDMWKQAGVQISLTPLEADALTAACCPAFDFDVINWGWSTGVDPASLVYIATSAQIPTGVSETGYANPEYDKLYDEQLVTVDKAKRYELIRKMQELLVRDTPYIIPYYAQNVEAYRSDTFTGWVIDPAGILSLNDRLSLLAITRVK